MGVPRGLFADAAERYEGVDYAIGQPAEVEIFESRKATRLQRFSQGRSGPRPRCA
jgi:hypothetical protein